ncbi:unnamed protein product [Clonostachys rosea f. rosea IK726]|uniref:Uncharacterized protein n=1 Tax=Clonostachys rosea f. rosea IK726 TaxID=1349383 RepID=A0ACA9UEA1_BIOOC|nr:unnamed protein product [Clonostachys rosea f. rosea IK726]
MWEPTCLSQLHEPYVGKSYVALVGSENPSFHCWLVPGQTKGLNAYPGHVYMLRSGSSENSKVLYRVPGLGHHLVAVSEADLEERDDNDPDTPGDPNEALEESRWKAMEKEYKDILQVDCSVIGGRLWVTDGPAATFQFSADDQYFKDKLFPSPKGKYLIAWEEVLAQQTKDSPLAEYETFGDIPAILATTQDPLSGEPSIFIALDCSIWQEPARSILIIPSLLIQSLCTVSAGVGMKKSIGLYSISEVNNVSESSV